MLLRSDLREVDTTRRGARSDVSGGRCRGARGSQRGSFPHLGDHSTSAAGTRNNDFPLRLRRLTPQTRRRANASTHNGRKALAYTPVTPWAMPARASALAIRTTVTHTAPFRPSAVGCRSRRPSFWAGRPERVPTSTAVRHPGRRHRRHAAGARPTTRTRSPAGQGSAAQRTGWGRPHSDQPLHRIAPTARSTRRAGPPPCRRRPARHTARHGRARASPMPAPTSPTTASSYNPARASSRAALQRQRSFVT